jgi:type I restriction enzyme S subunit
MELKQGYKQTEIGVMPEEWGITELGKIGVFSKGSGVRKDQSNSGEIACVRYGELYTKHNNYIKTIYSFISKEVSLQAKRLKKGDILFAGSGETKAEIGKSAAFIDEIEAYAGGDIVILTPKEFDSMYLGYLLNASFIQSQKASRGQGDAVVHISSNNLSSIKIPQPTLQEQTAIANALSDMDALISQTEKLIEKKKAIKQGAMQELLTGRTRILGFGGNCRYKQTEIGLLPEDWEVKSVGDIFRFYSTSNYSKAEMTYDGEIGCIHYGLVHAVAITDYDLTKGVKYYVNSEQGKYEIIKDGDIVMVDASEDLAGINKSVEFCGTKGKKYIAGLHTFLMRDTDSIFVDRFRGAILNSSTVKIQLLRLAVGMKVYGVSKTQLKTIIIPIPSKPEQIAIMNTLTGIDGNITILETKLKKLKQQKQGMMQALFTGKIRLA